MGNLTKKKTKDLLEKLPPQDLGNVISQLIDSKRELAITQEQETTKRIQINNKLTVSLKNLELKRDVMSTMLHQEYGLREENIEKMFELVEKALDSEKNDVVIAAIDGIVSMVKHNPMSEIEKIAQAFESDEEELII